MPHDPTRTDFVDLDGRVRAIEPVAKQLERLSIKVDDFGLALSNLVRFEERQVQQLQRMRDLADQVDRNRERADARLADIEKQHQTLRTELHGYVQRYLGISAAVSGLVVVIGGAWAVASRFIPSHL